MTGSRHSGFLKTAAYVIALLVALSLSLALYVMLAADPAPGKHMRHPNVWEFAAAVTVSALAWWVVWGLNQWRKRQ